MSNFANINEAEILASIAAEPLLGNCSEAQKQLFVQLVEALVQGQSRMNLTAIRNPAAMVRYHLADSVALDAAVQSFPVEGGVHRAADVGTGGGFPLLPLAILWPKTKWVGIESIGKKARFVEETGVSLGLKNVTTIAARAEDVGHGAERESFDLVTSRAVGPVASLLEVEMPLLRVGGRIYLMKTDSARPEWEACDEFLKRLGGRAVGEYAYKLEGDEQPRVIYVAEKVLQTPVEYPRAAGVPFKKPLVKVEGN